MTRAPLPVLVSSLVMLGLGACASDPAGRGFADHGRGGFEGRGRGPRLPNVFISPAGQPFRAPPDAPYPVAAWFAQADADHDGKLTRAEFEADALAFFHRLDTNHDGVIDGFEVDNYEQNVAPEILPHIEGLRANEGMDESLDLGDTRNRERSIPSAHRGRAGGSELPSVKTEPVQGAAVYSLIDVAEPVTAADAQFDSRITQAEFLAAIDRRFDKLDPKGQGYLLLAQLPKTPIQKLLISARKAREAAARRGASAPGEQDAQDQSRGER